MKIGISLILFLLFAVSLFSCQRPIDKAYIPGIYTWNESRIDTLEIRADGTYEYWTFEPGRKIPNRGTWIFIETSNKIEFENENFPFINNHVAGGSWIAEIKEFGDEIRIVDEVLHGNYLFKFK